MRLLHLSALVVAGVTMIAALPVSSADEFPFSISVSVSVSISPSPTPVLAARTAESAAQATGAPSASNATAITTATASVSAAVSRTTATTQSTIVSASTAASPVPTISAPHGMSVNQNITSATLVSSVVSAFSAQTRSAVRFLRDRLVPSVFGEVVLINTVSSSDTDVWTKLESSIGSGIQTSVNATIDSILRSSAAVATAPGAPIELTPSLFTALMNRRAHSIIASVLSNATLAATKDWLDQTGLTSSLVGILASPNSFADGKLERFLAVRLVVDEDPDPNTFIDRLLAVTAAYLTNSSVASFILPGANSATVVAASTTSSSAIAATTGATTTAPATTTTVFTTTTTAAATSTAVATTTATTTAPATATEAARASTPLTHDELVRLVAQVIMRFPSSVPIERTIFKALLTTAFF
ncbi:hypothetical protein HK105_202032 [Polyrhizophydium stewartii]|uniref:Uncharacterized protein n=1 Tax=Polyrhizophydium stewartii TaxID=2732419 RepID=A0ABR4NGP4_9FUNG